MSFSQFEQATPNPDPAPKAMGHDFRLNKTKDRIPPEIIKLNFNNYEF